jgi:heparosan-N-sulfate-glucuronate 5-epimerase
MFTRYFMRFKKWFRYASGKSYQHITQGQGEAFVLGQVKGYYNDLRHKADWNGQLSAAGVPLVKTDTDPAFDFPIVIFQWGLGSWDRWLLSDQQDEVMRAQCLKAADYAVSSLTENGGWLCWTGLKRPTISPYSAMAQGEGISLLVRAYQILPHRTDYIETAKRAAQFMLHSGYHGLLSTLKNGAECLQEYPGKAFNGVLNGWVFAIIGLYDLSLTNKDTELRTRLDSLVHDLARSAHLYDTGYWSHYDLSGHNIASGFYHDLHITQLKTLSLIFPKTAKTLGEVIARFETYQARGFNKFLSLGVKVVQKLTQPAVGEMQ